MKAQRATRSLCLFKPLRRNDNTYLLRRFYATQAPLNLQADKSITGVNDNWWNDTAAHRAIIDRVGQQLGVQKVAV